MNGNRGMKDQSSVHVARGMIIVRRQKMTKCQKCKKAEAHHEHHKDGDHKNNDPKNKQMLCTKCHSKIHGISPKQSELKWFVLLRDRAIRVRNVLNNQERGFGRIEYLIPEDWSVQTKYWNSKIGRTI